MTHSDKDIRLLIYPTKLTTSLSRTNGIWLLNSVPEFHQAICETKTGQWKERELVDGPMTQLAMAVAERDGTIEVVEPIFLLLPSQVLRDLRIKLVLLNPYTF